MVVYLQRTSREKCYASPSPERAGTLLLSTFFCHGESVESWLHLKKYTQNPARGHIAAYQVLVQNKLRCPRDDPAHSTPTKPRRPGLAAIDKVVEAHHLWFLSSPLPPPPKRGGVACYPLYSSPCHAILMIKSIHSS